jgi:hypothetical protein
MAFGERYTPAMNRVTAPLRVLLVGALIAILADCNGQPKSAAATSALKPTGKSRLEETFSPKYGETVLRGVELVGSVRADRGALTVFACETTNARTREHARGVVITVSSSNSCTAYLDYDEIQSVLSAIAYVSKVDHSSTPLQAFQTEYASRGGLSVAVTGPATGSTFSEVSCGAVKFGVTTEQLAKFAALMSQAKTLLDAKTSP